jgi:hypothetical protein
MKEILLASYYEHFKFAKELALIYPLDNPRRVKIEKEINTIQKKLEALKS